MRNFMLPLPRTTFHAPHLFHGRAKLLALAAICAAGLPGPLPAQWSTGSGGTIYYHGGSVGIGTASPSEKLEVGDGYGPRRNCYQWRKQRIVRGLYLG